MILIVKRITQLSAVLTLLLILSCSKEKKVIIKGEISNSNASTIYLSEFNLVSSQIVDSAKIDSDGEFKFKVKTAEPKFYQLMLSPNNFILLLAEPGANIRIIANAKNLPENYTIEGSKGSAQVKDLTSQLSQTKKMIDTLVTISQTYSNSSKPDTAALNKLNRQYISIKNAQRRYSIKFIIEHLSSMASIVALYQQFDENSYVLNQNKDLQYVKLVSDSLMKYYPESKIVKTLWSDRNRLLKELNNLKISQLASNAKVQLYPNLSLPSINGDTILLNELKSKLVILNFWNPGNKDCVSILADLKDLYKRYNKKGLEIYNVSLMSDVRTWIGMVVNNELPGINVIDPAGINSYSARIYNVKELPALYIIDPKKGFLEKNIFGENLEAKIEELFK